MNDFMLHGISYQCRYRVCNKSSCRCHSGKKHGPYWYAYSDRLVYIGKVLPENVLVDLARLEGKQEFIKKKIKALDVRERALSKELREVRELKEKLRLYSEGRGDPSCLRIFDTRPTRNLVSDRSSSSKQEK
jgi:hypothetical protein